MAIDCHGLVGLKEGSILIYSAVCACRGIRNRSTISRFYQQFLLVS